MCTTYLATELVREFEDYDLIGNPRLVRLNPNVPWKTRGNGAISLLLGKGQGRKKKIGQIGKKSIHAYHFGVNLSAEKSDFERVCKVVDRLAVFDDENTNPGIVIFDRKPSESFYWHTARGIVTLEGLDFLVEPTFKKGWKNGRGQIGATAAVAWKPKDRTYEIIAYRERKKWGNKRKIDEASVISMDNKFFSTFNNYDYEEKHMAIAPNSPCPVLFGIRGDLELALPKAMKAVKSEAIDRWLIFLTNQGTDDHIYDYTIGNLKPFNSVRSVGVVSRNPEMLEGGHLVFRISSSGYEVDCTIYEPAKKFREIGAALRIGDIVIVYGGVREDPFTINVEKIKIEQLADYMEKVSNPKCPTCKKGMKSIGKGQGYRCVKCGTKARERDAVFKPAKRSISEGWYEPPVSARRHLSKPLKRMKIG